MASSTYRWRLAACTVALIAAATVTVILVTRGPGVPSAAVVPLASGDRLVAQRVGKSTVDDAQPEQYRYLAIAGKPNETRAALMTDEFTTMRRQGWTLQASQSVTLVKSSVHVVHVPITTPGASVDMGNVREGAYATLATAATVHQATSIEIIDLFKPEIRRAVAQQRPVLLVTLDGAKG